jgi:hypothetical protein
VAGGSPRATPGADPSAPAIDCGSAADE